MEAARPLEVPVWSRSGPPLTDELRAEVQRVLGELAHYVQLPPVAAMLDRPAALAAVREAWAVLREVPSSADAPPGSCLYDLNALDLQLTRLAIVRFDEAGDALSRAISRLEGLTCSVPELVRLVPELICELGFSRASISRVEDGIWTVELLYVADEPEWSEELTLIGHTNPQPLTPSLYEHEMLTTRRGIIAANVLAEPWRSHQPLNRSLRTRSYVAAPIISDGEVVGFVHAEPYREGREVDELDRKTLEVFAQAVCLALSRAALVTELETAHRRLTTAARSVERAVGGVHRIPSMRVTRGPGDVVEGMVVRSGALESTIRPLPATLTARELEVLALVAAGKTNAVIAHRLSVAESTVKQHVKNILRKLMVGTRSEAVSRWFQAGGVADA